MHIRSHVNYYKFDIPFLKQNSKNQTAHDCHGAYIGEVDNIQCPVLMKLH